MNIWNPIETHRAEQAYEQNQKALGKAPELIRIDGTMASHEFDEQGNPIDRRATAETRYDVEQGEGLLSDLNSPENWLKYATELTKTAGGTPIGGAILNQMNSGAIAINKARADNEILKGNIQMIERDIMGTAHDNEQPVGQHQQPQQVMNPLAQQVTQNVQAQPNMPVSPNVAPVATTSQNLGTSVQPQVSPVRGDSRALPQPAPAQTLDDRVAEYAQKRRALEGKLLWTGMPGGAGAKAAIESRLKALDVEYGMGPETTNFIQDYNQAVANGYKGSMEQWKKAGAVNMANTVVTPEQSGKLRNANNEPAPVGMPYDQVWASGYRPVDSASQKKQDQLVTGTAVTDNIENKLFGKSGLLVDSAGKELPSSLFDRLAQTPEGIYNYYSQDDIRIKDYEDYKIAVMSPFVKSLGEVGALAEGDVDRALGFFPDMFPVPDSPKLARQKIKNMRYIISKGNKIKELQNRFKIVKGQSEDGMTYIGGDPRADGNWINTDKYNPYAVYTFQDYKGE